jgi:hypothetical protein
MYEPRHAPLAARDVFLHRMLRSAGVAAVIIGGSLALGIAGYRYFEGMHWIDAFLNAAMLLGGMGPVGPDLHTDAGKVFAGVYALYSGIIALVAAGILLTPIFHRFVHRFHLEEDEPATRDRHR